MIALGKVDNLFGKKSNKMLLTSLKGGYKNHQYYIYQIIKADFIQNGKPKLIAYVSKRLPEAAQNYSITDLEWCGLAVNIVCFAHLLKKLDFDAIVDHLALTPHY